MRGWEGGFNQLGASLATTTQMDVRLGILICKMLWGEVNLYRQNSLDGAWQHQHQHTENISSGVYIPLAPSSGLTSPSIYLTGAVTLIWPQLEAHILVLKYLTGDGTHTQT